ncbi:hypothetical protein HON36_00700 [Candidatus Parcubacteria bacterium]|jgi:hypothetical protein|nr:hypothetical protein [Candidatus Parcubacteria bacterium]
MNKFLLSILALAFVFSFQMPAKATGSYQVGALLAQEGSGNAAVYYVASDGKKYVFPDLKTYNTWYSDFDDVVKVSIEELDQYIDGGVMTYRAGSRLVTHQNTAKIYAVSPRGTLHWISTGEIAQNLYGPNWTSMVQDILPGYFSSSYTKGDDLENILPTGALIKNQGIYYYIQDGKRRKMLDTSTFEKNNFNFNFLLELDDVSAYANGQDIIEEEEELAGFHVPVALVPEPEEEPEEEVVVTNVADQKILLLAHSVGTNFYEQGEIANWFENYNTDNNTTLNFEIREYPDQPYAWSNYPYDYWNLWVNEACSISEESSECLDTLASQYDVINIKHSYTGSDVLADVGGATASVNSPRKSLESYKLQYQALRDLFDQYPETMFVVWTISPRHPLYNPASGGKTANAIRAGEFHDWTINTWLSEDGKQHPNIKIFDFRNYLADEDDYLKYDYRTVHTWSESHPNNAANEYIGPVYSQFIIDSIENFF